MFLAQFDLKENQSKLFAAAARRYARSGARSVAERARPDHLRRSVNLSAATCCRISSRDTEGPVRLRILLAVIGTLSRCSAWMAASIVSIFHFGITWLVMIASHSAAHVSPSATSLTVWYLFRAAQHGQRDSIVARAATNLRRIVAIEFGTWRSGRNGGCSGLVTFA